MLTFASRTAKDRAVARVASARKRKKLTDGRYSDGDRMCPIYAISGLKPDRKLIWDEFLRALEDSFLDPTTFEVEDFARYYDAALALMIDPSQDRLYDEALALISQIPVAKEDR